MTERLFVTPPRLNKLRDTRPTRQVELTFLLASPRKILTFLWALAFSVHAKEAYVRLQLSFCATRIHELDIISMDSQKSTATKRPFPADGTDSTQTFGTTNQSSNEEPKAKNQPLNTSTERPSAFASARKDGVGMAWLQVIGSFFLWFNTWGLVNAFGVYQTYYQLELLTSSTPSEISWIGSLQVFLLMVRLNL